MMQRRAALAGGAEGESRSAFVGLVSGIFDPNGSFDTSTITISDGSGGSVWVVIPPVRAVGASFGGFLPGTYTARLTVTESVSDPRVQPVSRSGSFTIKVAGPIRVTAIPIAADYLISTGQIEVATFIDGDPDATSWYASIDWGDGHSSEGIINGMTVSGTHTYDKAGDYIATVIVSDNDSNEGQNSVEAFVGPFLTVTATADAYEFGSDGNFHFDLTSAVGGSYIAPEDIGAGKTGQEARKRGQKVFLQYSDIKNTILSDRQRHEQA